MDSFINICDIHGWLSVDVGTALNSLANLDRVDLIWMLTHSNIVGNEKAGELAKSAALRTRTQVVIYVESTWTQLNTFYVTAQLSSQTDVT